MYNLRLTFVLKSNAKVYIFFPKQNSWCFFLSFSFEFSVFLKKIKLPLQNL